MTSNQNVGNATDKNVESARQLAHALGEVGGAWARYGLGVARLYLETGARSLSAAASAVGALAESLEDSGAGRSERSNVVDARAH